jgi:hypothetical protein
MFLIDRSDPGGFRQNDLAAERDEITQDQPKQRRLANAVPANETDLRAGRYGDARRIEEAAAPGVKDEILDPKHIAGADVTMDGEEKGRSLSAPGLR